MKTRIKVCGITNLEDALVAVEAGTDALGFLFAESPRRVTPERAAAIIRELPPFVATVGVFVDQTPEKVLTTARTAGLTAVQLHGAEAPEEVAHLAASGGPQVVKAFRVRSAADGERLAPYRGCCRAFLLDAYVPGAAGGTGQTFDWGLALEAKAYGVPILLAGGLTPENVAQATRQVRPYAVDVSSGVEVAPGRKDHGKVRAFIAAVRDADASARSSHAGLDWQEILARFGTAIAAAEHGLWSEDGLRYRFFLELVRAGIDPAAMMLERAHPHFAASDQGKREIDLTVRTPAGDWDFEVKYHRSMPGGALRPFTQLRGQVLADALRLHLGKSGSCERHLLYVCDGRMAEHWRNNAPEFLAGCRDVPFVMSAQWLQQQPKAARDAITHALGDMPPGIEPRVWVEASHTGPDRYAWLLGVD